MQIGSVTLSTPFILAPLAGYTDLPFRLLCREYGAACCFSEMISCHGLAYRQEKTVRMLATEPAERPVAIQLFGAEPGFMGRAAALVSNHPIDIIDINMGCPVRKVVKKGAGSALMRTPGLAREIIRQVVANTDRPVTVKIRSGWTHDAITAPEFAQMAEEAGAAAVTVHGRTWSDGFGGTVDWGVIAAVKRAVAIPVIGNGDLMGFADGERMMQDTGCDGVMIGRAALGAPWVFAPEPLTVTMAMRTTALLRHLALVDRFLPAERLLGHLKSSACRYFKGAPGSAAIRQQIFATPSFAGLVELTRALDQE